MGSMDIPACPSFIYFIFYFFYFFNDSDIEETINSSKIYV